MRTYKQQVDAVEARLVAHSKRRRKQIKSLYVATSVFIITMAVVVAGFTINYSNNNIFIFNKSENKCADVNQTYELSEMENGSEEKNTSDSNILSSVSDIDFITATTFYGKISKSNRSDSEIIKMTGEKSGGLIAYEDNQNIYFFYSNGALHSILNTSEYHTKPYLEADNESIKPYAATLIKRYFLDFNESDYSIVVDHSNNAFPAWNLTYTVKDNGVTTEKYIIRLLDNGDMYYLQHQSCDGDTSISVKSAVDIALASLNKTYKLDINKATERYNISAFVTVKNNNSVYNIEVDGIPIKYGDFETKKAYWVEISASSGAVLNIYQSR